MTGFNGLKKICYTSILIWLQMYVFGGRVKAPLHHSAQLGLSLVIQIATCSHGILHYIMSKKSAEVGQRFDLLRCTE